MAEYSANRVSSIKGGVKTTILGAGAPGAASSAPVSQPEGIWVDSKNSVYVAMASSSGNKIVRTTASGIVSSYAGNGQYVNNPAVGTNLGDGGQATSALVNPYFIHGDNADRLFVADFIQRRIRKIETNGIISTIAGGGGGAISLSVSMVATSAAITDNPVGVIVNAAGSVYFTGWGGGGVYEITTGGMLTKLKGELKAFVLYRQ